MSPANNLFGSFLTKKGPTIKAMQEVLRRIGETTTGTKDVVQRRLLTRVWQDKMGTPSTEITKRKARILSIDMGIRNLAYCVADVERSPSILDETRINICAWRRTDLNEAFQAYSRGDQTNLATEAAMDDQDEADLYTPESLSLMAFWFLNKTLLDWKPDIILIERQRWRSAGSPTIQQWTVRVNTLEAMMWAVITTLKSDRNRLFNGSTYAVDPKRVGHFWLDDVAPAPAQKCKKKASKSTSEVKDAEEEHGEHGDDDPNSSKKLSRGKAEKKAKIQLLRTWLNSDTPSTTLSLNSKTAATSHDHPNISFSFSNKEVEACYSADATRQGFLYVTDIPAERTKRQAYFMACEKKVDDITDCFLQATTWVAWAENLRRLRPQVEEFQSQMEEKLGWKLVPGPKHFVTAVEGLQASMKKRSGPEKSSRQVVKKSPKAKKTKASTSEGVELI